MGRPGIEMFSGLALEVLEAREVNRKIERLGGVHVRTLGSHERYRVTVDNVTASTAVPQHPGDIPNGTLARLSAT